MSLPAITSKKLLDAINKYVYIVPSVKQVILQELGLIYNPNEDTWKHLDARTDSSSLFEFTDEIEDCD